MAFATYSDLEVFLNTSFDSGQQAQASMLLAQASSAITAACDNQQIELVTDDEVVLKGNWSCELTLPQVPVVDVTAVDIDGTVLTEDAEWVWDSKRTLYRGRRPNQTSIGIQEPWPLNPYLYWGGDSAQVTVTYSHGFATVPEAIVGVCLALAQRQIADPGGNATSETTGPFSITRSDAVGAMTLTAAEVKLCRQALGLR